MRKQTWRRSPWAIARDSATEADNLNQTLTRTYYSYDDSGRLASVTVDLSPASAGITRETTVDEAARRLATDLRAIPGIERFGAVKLEELERSGPRPLRTMWRIARESLDAQYGQLTIGELLEMYGTERPT